MRILKYARTRRLCPKCGTRSLLRQDTDCGDGLIERHYRCMTCDAEEIRMIQSWGGVRG